MRLTATIQLYLYGDTLEEAYEQLQEVLAKIDEVDDLRPKLIELFDEKGNDIEEIPCPNCDGKGVVEEWPIECGKPASECCGGCSRDVECEECFGSGIKTIIL